MWLCHVILQFVLLTAEGVKCPMSRIKNEQKETDGVDYELRYQAGVQGTKAQVPVM